MTGAAQKKFGGNSFMDAMTLMNARHSVRQYEDKPIPAEILAELKQEIAACNRESGLHIQLVTDEPKAFDGFIAHYGKFRGVKNYLALVGPKGAGLDEKCGYYGERLVLKAQALGLNTCWVALTYSRGKSRCTVAPGEKLVCVIALGYGKTQGAAHKTKTPAEVSNVTPESPQWFKDGVDAALLAPTAMNQQQFMLTLKDDVVEATARPGVCAKVDLGIVKYHFELAAGRENFKWASPNG